MKIWVVLPAYNEELAISPLIESLVNELTEEKRNFSIIVVNDGSTDNTLAVATQWAAKAPILILDNVSNKGLAETIKRGLMEAVKLANERDIIITMDADNTHPVGLAIRMIRLIREGNDVVIASRFREGSFVAGVPWNRRFLSFCASWLFRIFFPTPGVRDYTSGYRAYRVSGLVQLMQRYGQDFISETGFSCMVDVLLRLREQYAIFTEVPMVLRYDKKMGNSKMKVMKTAVDTVLLLIRRRFLSESNPVDKG